MAISLSKGSSINLSKEHSGLSEVIVGLGWDVAKKKKGGFFKSLVSSSSNFDLDASAILCANGRYSAREDLVYFGHQSHNSGAVKHMGDNLTGEGDGDDECIKINLSSLPEKYDKIGIVVNIYSAKSRQQDFSMIENAFVRIVDAKTNVEICRYDISGNYDGKTAMIFGNLYKQNGDWQFEAVGEGTSDSDVMQLANRYN